MLGELVAFSIPESVGTDPAFVAAVRRHVDYLGSLGLQEQMSFVVALNWVVGNIEQAQERILEDGKDF